MEAFALKLVYAAIASLIAIAYGLTTAGVVYKIFARVQGRVGPPIYQPFINLGRALFVRTAVHHGPMFFVAPIFRSVGGIGLFLLIPAVYGWEPGMNFSGMGDMLLVLYFMFFGTLGNALGASAAGHPHSPIGISRGLQQMTAYELPFTLGVVAIVASSSSFDIVEIVAAQQGSFWNWNLFQHPLASAAILIAMLGMNMYPPFNVVGAPNEIPIGPRTPHHAAFMGTLRLGAAAFAIAKTVLIMDLLLGGATTVIGAFVKVFVLYMWTVFIGGVHPRFRVDQSIAFFVKWPTLIGAAGLAFALLS